MRRDVKQLISFVHNRTSQCLSQQSRMFVLVKALGHAGLTIARTHLDHLHASSSMYIHTRQQQCSLTYGRFVTAEKGSLKWSW